MGLRGAVSAIVLEGFFCWEPWRRTSRSGQTGSGPPDFSRLTWGGADGDVEGGDVGGDDGGSDHAAAAVCAQTGTETMNLHLT